MIRVLVVDDSPTATEFLVNLIESDPEMRVIGTARDGEEALAFLAKERPDVVTMDVHMPRMDGLEATRRIMERFPLPVVVVSASWHESELASTFRAIDAGALTLIAKPSGGRSAAVYAQSQEFVRTVKLMAEVKVVRRTGRRTPAVEPVRPEFVVRECAPERALVAIGASTGGPPVLRSILKRLPPDFPAPILAVQHISSGFLRGMVEWLNFDGCRVEAAEHGVCPVPGTTYLAPDEMQMGVTPGGAVELKDEPAENGLRPSVSYLFRSLAELRGIRLFAVLLTGMGKDGAAELKLLREKGAVTIAQDRDSSVVHGMPGEAIRIGGAMHVLPPERIADFLLENVLKH